ALPVGTCTPQQVVTPDEARLGLLGGIEGTAALLCTPRGPRQGHPKRWCRRRETPSLEGGDSTSSTSAISSAAAPANIGPRVDGQERLRAQLGQCTSVESRRRHRGPSGGRVDQAANFSSS